LCVAVTYTNVRKRERGEAMAATEVNSHSAIRRR
jgi:hypothetical protein